MVMMSLNRFSWSTAGQVLIDFATWNSGTRWIWHGIAYCFPFVLAAQDPVLKDQVLNCNITHSKHGHVTRKKDPVLNGECSPFKTGSFFLVTWPCFEWVMLPFKTWSFKTGSRAGRNQFGLRIDWKQDLFWFEIQLQTNHWFAWLHLERTLEKRDRRGWMLFSWMGESW